MTLPQEINRGYLQFKTSKPVFIKIGVYFTLYLDSTFSLFPTEWGRGEGTDREGAWGVQTSRHPHPLISVPATFLNFFFPPFFPPPVHLPPSFLPGVPNSVHLHPYPPLPRRLPVTKGEKKKKESENDKYKN